MFCPNHTRHKRVAPGGGHVECRQHVTVTLVVPVEIRVKPGGLRAPLTFERMIPRRIVRHGLRIRPTVLAAAFRENGTLKPRIGCGCGWSLDRMTIRPCARPLARKTAPGGGTSKGGGGGRRA